MDNQKCYKATLTHIHWTAIIAGAFVGVGLSFLLNIFSMAIGLSAYSSLPNVAPTIAIGGVLGLLIGVIVSMGVAGFVAGYLGRFHHCYCHGGVIYGFITWSLVLMLSALLIMPFTHYVSFYEENLDPNLAPTQISSADVNVSVTPSQNTSTQKMMDTNPKQLHWKGWILFVLFFLGGISSCISACYGMCCEKEEQLMKANL
ncbi:MAG: hypothetical protein QM652_03140 [Legionella sp.]|uniref:hypothetical protein n=1 Tax=Legionella sp. TaxID=459 RepID=UPI0039E5A8A0